MTGEAAVRRQDFPFFRSIQTRWMDNDVYGHVNNVVYYSFFDTAVNGHLLEEGVLDYGASPVFGVVAETRCRFFKELAFPDLVEAGMRIVRLGNSGVTYEIGLFRAGDSEAAAFGHFVHVYVDRATRRPTRIPDAVRAVMQPLVVGR